jgi:hypothetical protein
MGPTVGHNVKISDVVKVLKEANTIRVLDTVGPDSPQVFVGPSDLQTPSGYAKFELPYLSALESNRVERKVGKSPFFVAPLSFKPPPGYSKIPFPAPHVGSVVVANVTENSIHEKDDATKVYSLPAQLPPINPELPSLVNSLQDQRHFLSASQKEAAAKFLQAVQHKGLDTSTERYTRHKESRHPYHDEVTIKPVRLPSKQTTNRFQQPPTQYQEAAVATVQPHFLETVQQNPTATHSAQLAQISTYQPPYPEQEVRQQQLYHGGLPSRQSETVGLDRLRPSQYKEAATQEKEHTISQGHLQKTKQTKSPSPQESPQVTSKYLNSEEESTRQPENFASDATVPIKQAEYNVPPGELQYPLLEPVVLTEPPKLIRPQENIPVSQKQYSVSDTYDQARYTTIPYEIQTRQPPYSESHSGVLKYTTPQYIVPEQQKQHPLLELSARPLQYEITRDGPLSQSQYSKAEGSAGENRSKLASQEDITHRQQQYPATAPPENIKYTVLQNGIPQLESQHPVLGVETAEQLAKHHRPQGGILLRPQGEEEQIYTNSRDKISQHRPQYSASSTEIPQSKPKHNTFPKNIPVLQPHYENTEASFVETQPNYATLQDTVSSGVTQYTDSDRFQSQYQFLGSKIPTEPALTSTTTTAPERATPYRGRSRGRYRPTSSATTTQASRSRSSHARGRRPAVRTSSEAPQLPATAADNLNPFDSSRKSPEKQQAHRFEAQRKDRTRSRSRSRSTTTTTTESPQYSSDLYQEEQYAPTSTKQSRIDTATENVPQFISPYQQQAPSGQVAHTQHPNPQVVFRERPSSESPPTDSGKVIENHFLTGEVPYIKTSGSNSDGKLLYTQVTNGQVSLSQTLNGQDAVGHTPNGNGAQPHIPVGQVAHIQTGSDEIGQLSSEQTYPNIQSGTLDEIQIQTTQVSQNHISSGHVDHGRIPTGLPNGEARTDQLISEHVNNNQTPNKQATLSHIPNYYNGHYKSSKDNKRLSFPASALSSTEAFPLQDGFLLHELSQPREETTRRQYSTLQNTKHRTKDVGRAYQTTFPSPTLDGKLRGQSDSQIVTSDRSAQQLDGEVTQTPSLVRIRGRVRGRPRVALQPEEQIATTTMVTPELRTTTVGRKHTNFLNRGSARKTQAPTSTPTAETTTPVNDKVRLLFNP